jgi:hypothetical protein
MSGKSELYAKLENDLEIRRARSYPITSLQFVHPLSAEACAIQGGVIRMRQPHIDDFVRLMTDIPELALHRGDIGVVRSTWFAPTTAYEVEFHPIGLDNQTRALLLAEQVQVEDGPLFDDRRVALCPA